MWLYNSIEFTSEMIGEHVGFVYCITNLQNDKKYIGKKTFLSRRTLPPLKGKKRKRKIVKESDWQDYYGSSEEIKQMILEDKADLFKREILHLCNSKGEMAYLEMKEQVDREVLLSDEYYNGIIQVKIHRSHVQSLRSENAD